MAGEFLSIGSKFGTPGMVAGTVAEIGNAALQWFGAKEASDADREYNRQMLDLYKEQLAESRERYGLEYGLQKAASDSSLKTASTNRWLAKKQLELEKEKAKAAMVANGITRMMAFANSPSTRGQFVNLWR